MEQEFLSIRELGEYLGMKTSTLYFHVENGSIPHYRVGRLIRFRKPDIDRWMEGQRRETIALRMTPGGSGQSLDIDAMVKKVVADTRQTGYTSALEKPGVIKGLRKEVDHGSI